ncbi:MAG: 1-acyl-sn-glycerol-3-phosphate acyltransferase [Leptospiraceae bacterium]|nr:1-acyl-sn-glycerol-3-phosphate acyltransferase [Leptospiraceae bacterium]
MLKNEKLSYPPEENDKNYYEHINTDYLHSLNENIISFLDTYYFRSRFIGFEEMPQRNEPSTPLIYASNHSGMSFPWDAIIFVGGLFKKSHSSIHDSVRALTAPALSASKYMSPYMIDNFWRRTGGVDATLQNFDTMMRFPDSNVLIYPEGIAGIGKGFDRRYELQQLSTSFIRMAIKYKTDIIPISVVNGEYSNPYSYKSDELNKLVQKLGIPYLPLGPISAMVPFGPFSFYMAMPAKLTFVMGNRIKIYEMTDRPLEKLKKKELHHLRDVVYQQMQEELDSALAIYGKDPYHFEELGDIWRDNLDRMLYILPSGWPLLFHEHERWFQTSGYRREKMPHGNAAFVEALIKNPMILSFTLPLIGWPALLKWKRVI